MNDYDWWCDYSPNNAKNNYIKFTGIIDENYPKPIQLTKKQLNTTKYITENLTTITFKEELNNRIKNNDVPSFFASTEY